MKTKYKDGEGMRELSREEHEMILNLFIMYFTLTEIRQYNKAKTNLNIIIKCDYIANINHPIFKTFKLCVPMDEYCEGAIHQMVNGISIKSQYSHNYIKEV